MWCSGMGFGLPRETTFDHSCLETVESAGVSLSQYWWPHDINPQFLASLVAVAAQGAFKGLTPLLPSWRWQTQWWRQSDPEMTWTLLNDSKWLSQTWKIRGVSLRDDISWALLWCSPVERFHDRRSRRSLCMCKAKSLRLGLIFLQGEDPSLRPARLSRLEASYGGSVIFRPSFRQSSIWRGTTARIFEVFIGWTFFQSSIMRPVLACLGTGSDSVWELDMT